MSRPRQLAAVLAGALAVAAGCGGSSTDPGTPPDPCAYRTAGAPWLAFSSAESGQWDIHLVRSDGTCRRPLTDDAALDFSPVWAPSGVVAFESERAPFTGIWLRSVETGTERRIDAGELRAASPAISPDGSTLAFEGRYAGSVTSSIFVVPLAGGTPREVTPELTAHRNGGPVFAPDGASLYFVSDRKGSWDVYRAPLAGAFDPERVTTGAGILGKPAVSPDGATLAFARAAGSSSEIVLFDVASATSTLLGVASAAEPAFDPAGGRLAVRVFRGLTANVDLVPLPASGAVRLTHGAGPDGTPAFDRRGR